MGIDVSLCMITYNKLPFLQRTIDAVINSLDESLHFEFIIFNNGSDDGTEEYLSMFSHVCPKNVECKILTGDKNYGLNAYGMIVPLATGDIIVTVDDDIFEIEPPGWEGRFKRVLTSRFGGRKFGYVSTDTINDDGGRWEGSPLGHASIDGMMIEIGNAGGWFAATTREVIDAVGGFHTGKGLMHLEDADFQSRVAGKGLLVGTLLDTRVFHARSPRFYTELGREGTYREKSALARLEGLTLEPLA